MEKSIVKQVFVLIAFTLAFIFILGLLLFNQAMGQVTDDEYYNKMTRREKVIAKIIERKYLDADKRVRRYFGNVVIREDDYINSSIIVMKGTVEIEGEVAGDVIAIFGEVELAGTAYVEGDVVSVGGKIWRSRGAKVHGDIVETSWRDLRGKDDLDDEEVELELKEGLSRVEEKLKTNLERVERELKDKQRELERRDREIERRFREIEINKKWESRNKFGYDDDHEPVLARYNRVEGLFLGLQLPSINHWFSTRHHFAIYGSGGYGFKNKEWRYQLGLQRWLGDLHRFTFGGEAHNLTESQDEWVIPSIENSLAAFFLKEDFQDFYQKQGYSIYASQNFTPVFKIGAEYHHNKFFNMPNKNNWALFCNKKSFRDNPNALPPGMNELELGSLVGRIVVDSRNKRKHPDKGWYIDAMAEIVGDYVESDQEFERYLVDIKHYQPLGWDENLNFHLRAASARGVLPPMYWFDMGGISTLRGYRYKELTGNRMVLAKLEYVLKTSNIHNIDIFFLNSFNAIFFVDTGLAWFYGDDRSYKQGEEPAVIQQSDSPLDGFDFLTVDKLRTNVGFALATEDNNFRIDFAKRTDRGDNDLTVTMRLSTTF